MQAGDYVRILYHRKWSILAVTVAIVGAWVAWSFGRPPVYQAGAEVLVKPVGVPDDRFQLSMETERRIAASLGVATVAAEKLQVEEPEGLLGGLSVEIEGETPVLSVRYAGPDPTEASRRAQALAESYLEYRRRQVVDDLVASSRALEQQLRVLRQRLSGVNERITASGSEAARQALVGQANTLAGQIGVLEQQLVGTIPPDNLQVGEILRPASVSSVPAQRAREGAVVLLAAVGLGMTQGLLREFMEGRLRGIDEVQTLLKAPVLGVVPRPRRVLTRRHDDDSRGIGDDVAVSEAFRRIKVALTLALERLGVKTVVVTAVSEDEGAIDFVATHLGVALARSGTRVVLIATDPGGGTPDGADGSDGAVELADLLSGSVNLAGSLGTTHTENLSLLRVVRPGPSASPTDLLATPEMEKLLQEAGSLADLVLVTTGPVLASADALSLGPVADGLLLVVDARSARRGDLQEVARQLVRVEANVVGTVVIGA